MAWTNPTTRSTGNLITASIWNTDLVDNLNYLKGVADQVDGFNTIVKTGDETLSSSTTLQDDNQLAFSVVASKIYGFKAMIQIDLAASAMGFKCGWSYPSGTTITWCKTSREADVGTFMSNTLQESGTENWIANSTGGFTVGLFGSIYVSTTPGTIQFRWAQNTSNASVLTVRTGSFIEYFLLN